MHPVLTTAIKHRVDERIYFSDFQSLVGDVCEVDVGIYRVTLSCILQIVQGHREVPNPIAAVENCASITRDCRNRRVVGYPAALSRGYGHILSRDAGARRGSRSHACGIDGAILRERARRCGRISDARFVDGARGKYYRQRHEEPQQRGPDVQTWLGLGRRSLLKVWILCSSRMKFPCPLIVQNPARQGLLAASRRKAACRTGELSALR